MRRMKSEKWTDEQGNERLSQLFLMNRHIPMSDGHFCSYVWVDHTSNAMGAGPETMAFFSDYAGNILRNSAAIYENHIENAEAGIKDACEYLADLYETGTYNV